ncbi:MAG: flagellar hook-length control protein FliK [Caulobacteraceae bacterium]
MLYNMNLVTAFKMAKPAESSKNQVAFGVSSNKASGKASSFKNNLTEAVKNREGGSDKTEYPHSDVSARKAEKNPQENKKVSAKNSDNKEENEKDNKEDSKKVKNAFEEILALLNELSNLQQAGAMQGEKQQGIVDKLKELMAAINTESTKGIENTAQNTSIDIKNIMEALSKLTGKMSNNAGNQQTVEISDLKEGIEELLVKLEDNKNDTAKPVTDEKSTVPLQATNNDNQTKKTAETVSGIENKTPELSVAADNQNVVKEVPDDKAVTDKAAAAGNNEKSDADNKVPMLAEVNSANPVKTPNGEKSEETDVKNAIDDKVQKVTVNEAKDSSKSGESGQQKEEASKEGPDAVKTVQGKTAGEDLNNVRLDAYQNEKVVEAAKAQTVEKPQTVQKADIINQIVKKAELVINDNQPEMKMQLEPENLGKLTLKIAVEKGLVTAKFVAESQEVKQVIESSFNRLRDMLQEKGIGVQNFSVTVGQDSREFNNQNNYQLWREAARTASNRNSIQAGYEGYTQSESIAKGNSNPYSYHEGQFDYRA